MRYLPFAVLLLLFACKPNTPEKVEWGLRSLDSMLVVIDTLEAQHLRTDRDSAAKVQTHVKDLYSWYRENYSDSTNRNFWIVDLSALDKAERIFRKTLGDTKEVEEGLKFSREQIKNLIESWHNGDLTEDRFYVYADEEAAALHRLYQKATFYYNEVPVALAIMDTLGPKLDSIRDHLTLAQ